MMYTLSSFAIFSDKETWHVAAGIPNAHRDTSIVSRSAMLSHEISLALRNNVVQGGGY